MRISPIPWILLLAATVAACAGRQEIETAPPSPDEQTYEDESRDRPESATGEGAAEGSAGSGQAGEGNEGAGDGSSSGGTAETAAPAGGAMTSGEEGASADQELSESIERFGEQLRSAAETAAHEGGGGAGGGEEDAGDVAGTGGGAGGEQDPEDPAARSQGTGSGGRAAAADPTDIPDGRDDDVVARQLREMAENEQDPELRAIYWQEYIDYKNGQKRTPPEKDEDGGAEPEEE